MAAAAFSPAPPIPEKTRPRPVLLPQRSLSRRPLAYVPAMTLSPLAHLFREGYAPGSLRAFIPAFPARGRLFFRQTPA